MKFRVVCAAALAVPAILFAGVSHAQAVLPIPEIGPYADIPGARELPSASTDYKVVFDISAGGKPDEPLPSLVRVARYLNTLAKSGVPASSRKIAVVFHGEGAEVILKQEAYAARNNGRKNASLALLEHLKAEGVDFRMCGQSAVGRKMPFDGISPAVEMNLAATVTLVNLQSRGYILVNE